MQLSILTRWAEEAARALTFAPERIDGVRTDALANAPCRTELGIPEPPPPASRALETRFDVLDSTTHAAADPDLDALVLTLQNGTADANPSSN